MSKTLFLLRHGKSKRGIEYTVDFTRPLSKRGKHNANLMGEFMKQGGCKPDLMISSSAKRAYKTAELAARAMNYKKDIQTEKAMYLSGPEAYITVLREVKKNVQSVMLVGHNPDLEDIVQIFTGKALVMPTAALVRIDFEIDSWKKISKETKGIMMFFKIPKELLSPEELKKLYKDDDDVSLE
jgi:phosphohistidine phosphatase